MFTRFRNYELREEEGLLGGGGGAPPAGTPPEPGAFEMPEWAQGVEFPEGVADDIKSDPSIKVFLGEDKKLNFGNMMKSYVHAQKQIGKDKVIVPGKDSTPEAWNDMFKKMGLPENVEGYELNGPAADEKNPALEKEFINEFKVAAHKAGILPKQAEQVLEFYQGQVKKSLDGANTIHQTSKEESIKSLRADFGEKFDHNLGLANKTLEHFGGEEIVKTIKDLGLSNDPGLVKFLVKVGGTLGDDVVKGINGGDNEDTQSLQDTIDTYTKDMGGAYYNKDHPEHDVAMRKVKAAFDKLTKFS